MLAQQVQADQGSETKANAPIKQKPQILSRWIELFRRLKSVLHNRLVLYLAGCAVLYCTWGGLVTFIRSRTSSPTTSLPQGFRLLNLLIL
jgi:hypothetical protein